MKTQFIVPLLFLLGLSSHAVSQSTPEAFLGLLPPIPAIDCKVASSQQSQAIEAFQHQISSVEEQLSEAISVEKQKNKKQAVSQYRKDNATAMSHLSEAELLRVTNKQTGQAEKNIFIGKSVQGQTGVSMEEMQKVKSMSKADRQKWANENFSQVMQAEQQTAAKTEPYTGQNASMVQLAEEQGKIAEALQHHKNRLEQIKSSYQITKEQARETLNSKLAQINNEYQDVNDGEGSTKQDVEMLRQKTEKIRKAKVEYCTKLTTLYIDYLQNHQNTLKENILPDLKRQEEIEYQIQKITYDTAQKNSFYRLSAIREYGNALRCAYENYISAD